MAIIGIASVAGTIASIPGLREPQTFFARPPAEWLGVFAPLLALAAVFFVILAGVANALIYGALARMYRQLNPDVDTATTFA